MVLLVNNINNSILIKTTFYFDFLETINLYTYSRTSLVRTPGDRRNAFALSGIRINQYRLNWKGFEGD